MNNTVEVNKMCRLCLADEEVNVRIFDEKGKEDQVYLKISTCLPIQISRDDGFPEKICDDCSDKVNIMYRLWNISASSEKKLSEWFEQWDANNKTTDSEITDLTDIDFETLINGGLSEIILKEPCTNDKLNQDVHIEEQLPHSTTLSETAEEEPCNNTIDTQDWQNDNFNQNVYIEELPHCTTLVIVEEDPGNNTTNTQDLQNDNLNQDVFIEEQLPHCTISETEEEELYKNITENDIFNQDAYIQEQLPHSTTLSKIIEEESCNITTDVQDSQNDCLNQDVSIEELPHSTTLEIVYSNTPEEKLVDEQEDIWEQELELSSSELPSSTTLETVSSEAVTEVQPITTCIVPTCDGDKNNTKKVFHPLPANEEIRNIWLKLISRHDLLEKPYCDLQQARVCGAHFDEAQYLSKPKKFHCIVANCDGITNNKRHTWHSLPKDYELREKWLLILKRPDLQDTRSALNRVCSAHFASWQFRSPVSENLNRCSIPLFVQDEQETANATTSPPVTPPKQVETPPKEPSSPPKKHVTASKQNATPEKQLVIVLKRLSTPEKQLPVSAKRRYLLRKRSRNSECRSPVSTPKNYNAHSSRKKRKVDE